MTVPSRSHHGKVHERRNGGDGGKIERKLYEVNTRAMSRGHNALMSKFKMGMDDVVSTGE